LSHIYLGAVAFGVTLLIASLFLHGGKDTDHGHDSAAALGWAPVTSIRFWVFLFAFGGAAGFALTQLGSSQLESGVGAVGVGWLSGTLAVAIIRALTKRSVSSEVGIAQLVGVTGTLLLPVAPGKPGKVRVELGGHAEDYVANVVDDGGDLPSGTAVLIVAEGDRGSLLVTKHEM
jgi:membrane protein implicated in regulation of membrane protease activity